MSESKPTIYGFLNGGSHEWWNVIAIAEDGTELAAHTCSSSAYFKHDLGFDDSNWKHDKYDAHYPDGWKLEWVERDDIAAGAHPEGLKRAFELAYKARIGTN